MFVLSYEVGEVFVVVLLGVNVGVVLIELYEVLEWYGNVGIVGIGGENGEMVFVNFI